MIVNIDENIDVNTNENTILTLEEVESKQWDDHCNNLEMNLVPCPHCHSLKQGKEIPKCLLALHTYTTYLSFADESILNDD